jgi:FkbM family methyltransferase
LLAIPQEIEITVASQMCGAAEKSECVLNGELQQSMMQFGDLTLKQCRYGWMLFSGPYIGKCFELYGQYSESEVAMMRRFLNEGSTAIDVGANIGDLTVPLARIVGTSGRVYAIESQPTNFNVLCANLALNGLANVKPVNVFVATTDQVDTSSPVWGRFAYVSETWETQFMALDSLDVRECHLIKVDVDGKELEVLESGEMLIEKHRPVIYFENDVLQASRALLSYLMGKLGYDLYWHPAPIFDPQNFCGNPVNHWAPKNIVSLMVVGLPSERKVELSDLRRIKSAEEWWDLG